MKIDKFIATSFVCKMKKNELLKTQRKMNEWQKVFYIDSLLFSLVNYREAMKVHTCIDVTNEMKIINRKNEMKQQKKKSYANSLKL